jgi:hypothetical protein
MLLGSSNVRLFQATETHCSFYLFKEKHSILNISKEENYFLRKEFFFIIKYNISNQNNYNLIL